MRMPYCSNATGPVLSDTALLYNSGTQNFGFGQMPDSGAGMIANRSLAIAGAGIPSGGLAMCLQYSPGNDHMGHIDVKDYNSNTYQWLQLQGLLFTDGTTLSVGTAAGNSLKVLPSGFVGVDNTNPLTTLDVGGTIRATNLNVPTSGSGVALTFNPAFGGAGSIACYKAGSGAVDLPLSIEGYVIKLLVDSSVTMPYLSSSGSRLMTTTGADGGIGNSSVSATYTASFPINGSPGPILSAATMSTQTLIIDSSNPWFWYFSL